MARNLTRTAPTRIPFARGGASTLLAALLVLGSAPRAAFAAEVSLRGELAAALTGSDATPRRAEVDVRYEPEISLRCLADDRVTVLAAGDTRLAARFVAHDGTDTGADADLYRLWLRLGTPRAEFRVGLQKLSFGSATLLRPLMWFDGVDPRDPLRRTDGVYALLLRYYWLDNMNIWLWGLLGNDEPKGWETLPSQDDEPEFGGRFQVPVCRGEAAISVHQRVSVLAARPPSGGPPQEAHVRERRVALDGKWDIGVGAWCEAVLQHQDDEALLQPYQLQLTLGLDTTFDLGQGLHALIEQFLWRVSTEPFGRGRQVEVSALSLRYPWGVVDEVGVILHYDWDARDVFATAEWRRTFDRWSVHLLAFLNPEVPLWTAVVREGDRFAGSGAQLLVVFDH